VETLVRPISQRFGILEKFSHESMNLTPHLLEVISGHDPPLISNLLYLVSNKEKAGVNRNFVAEFIGLPPGPHQNSCPE
jgi:hypothetical protein